MKQVFPFLMALLLCFTMGCNKCTLTKQGDKKSTMQDSDYSYLSDQEKDFASQLSPDNQKIFCEKFNSQQRASTMKLYNINESKKNNPDGQLDQITPDEAVQKIYHAHRMDVQDE